MSLNGP